MCIVAMCLSFTACNSNDPQIPSGTEDGAIVNGVFKVSANKSVRFSQGNLQYTQSTKTWSFAEHQYDMLAEKNLLGAKCTNEEEGTWKGTGLADKIDLFGWSANNKTAQWGISVSDNAKDYSGTFVDWGQNAISNGGNKGNIWRTLSIQEWMYLFQNNRWTMAIVVTNTSNKVYGALLLPNDFKTPKGITLVEHQNLEYFSMSFYEGQFGALASNYASNTYSASQFAQLQSLGCVFIPANSPLRRGTQVDIGVSGDTYWSYNNSNKDCNGIIIYGEEEEWAIFIEEDPQIDDIQRFYGCSVRLVQDM